MERQISKNNFQSVYRHTIGAIDDRKMLFPDKGLGKEIKIKHTAVVRAEQPLNQAARTKAKTLCGGGLLDIDVSQELKKEVLSPEKAKPRFKEVLSP